MGLKIFKIEEFDYTHERQQFRNLCDVLTEKFKDTDDHNLLFANINFNGTPLDALLIKKDAIVVIEMKHYGGSVKAAENGDWHLGDGTIVKGGGSGKNPFQQVKGNKWAVANTLDTWFRRSYVYLGHVSGVVVFDGAMTIDDTLISPKVKSWFHVTDMAHVAALLEDITSTSISYTNDDLDALPVKLNCADKAVFTTDGWTKQAAHAQPTATVDLFESVRSSLRETGFHIAHEQHNDHHDAEYAEGALRLCNFSAEYVSKSYGRLYKHQYAAVQEVKAGRNVCVSTGTSSGKTAIFHLAALETFAKDPHAKILAVYPMKALGKQQEQIWDEKLRLVFPGIRCGKIDGNTANQQARLQVLNDCQVVSITPDTIHSFLLGRLSDQGANGCGRVISEFLKHLRLVIIDEVHLYTGLMGTNGGYTFRRLNACVKLLQGAVPQYITASATIANPLEHSHNISGVDDFVEIDQLQNTAAQSEVNIYFVQHGDPLQALPELLPLLAERCVGSRSITFFDSRAKVSEVVNAITDKQGFYPFKAGYEQEDFDRILDNLQNNQFRGVVSTSSLEVGIDIGNLNIAILYGIPSNTTSLHQRIGRVGRGGNQPAVVILIDDPRSFSSDRVFRNPSSLLSLPVREPALYFDNERLMNIQANHFVYEGQEFQSVGGDEEAYAKVEGMFPQAFNEICKGLFQNQLSEEFEAIKVMSDKPELEYSLRQIDGNVQVKDRNEQHLGTLPIQNVMREAYPGAIYTYNNQQYRVQRVEFRRPATVEVKAVNPRVPLNTKPTQNLHVWPQRQAAKFEHIKYGNLDIVFTRILERTSITGFQETRGRNRRPTVYPYPNQFNRSNDFHYDNWLQGVFMASPAMTLQTQNALLSQLFYECFLENYAFERGDVEHSKGTLTGDIDDLRKGTRFIAVYDKIRDGLNITKKLMEKDTLLKCVKLMKDTVDNGEEDNILEAPLSAASKAVVYAIYQEILDNNPVVCNGQQVAHYGIFRDSPADYVVVDSDGQETVERVTISEVGYQNGSYFYFITKANGDDVENVPEAMIRPVPGESRKALYQAGVTRRTTEVW